MEHCPSLLGSPEGQLGKYGLRTQQSYSSPIRGKTCSPTGLQAKELSAASALCQVHLALIAVSLDTSWHKGGGDVVAHTKSG